MARASIRRGVLIVIDRLLCDGLAALLEQHGAAQVLAASDSLTAANRLVACCADVDFVLLDVTKSDQSQRAATVRGVRKQFQRAQVILLAADDAAGTTSAENLAGADSLVQTNSGRDDLLRAVGAVRPMPDLNSRPATANLTPPEIEVLKRVARGQRTAEIAASLHRSPKTIEKHRANVLRKLGLRSSVDMVAYAVFEGLVTRERP